MWFMNKLFNPILGLILRSPLHGMLSAALLLLTYTGRKSGKEFTLVVQYAQNQRDIWIVPGEAHKKTWWLSLRGGAPVKLRLAGQALTGTAVVLEGPTDAARIAQALGIYLQRFPASAQIYNIHREQDGSFNEEDLTRVAESQVVVRVQLDQ